MTGYFCLSSADTLSTTIRVSIGPLLTSKGPPVRGRTASSMRGRSLMNWRVLSGRSRERLIPILRDTSLIHWNTTLQFRVVGFVFAFMWTYYIKILAPIILLFFRLTAPGLGTGTSPVYITHLTWDVSTATGVLNFPSLKMSLMSDTLYAHTADTSDKLLETQISQSHIEPKQTNFHFIYVIE